MNPEEITLLQKKLEENGLVKVKQDLANSLYAGKKKLMVLNWIKSKEDEGERQQQDIGHHLLDRANQIAQNNNLISWIALIVAIIALLVSLFK